MYKIPFKFYGNAPSSSRNGTKIKFIVVHWTENTSRGANAEMHHRFYMNKNNGVSSHYTTDSNGIIQSVGDSRAAWTVGQATRGTVNVGAKDGTAFTDLVYNNNTLNIEMCVNSDGDWNRTRKITLELVKNLMKKFNIKPTHVVRHHDSQRINNNGVLWRKDCPGNMKPNNWADWWKFKEEIKEPIEIEWDLSKSSIGKAVGGSELASTEEKPVQDRKGTAQFDYIISITDMADYESAWEIAKRHKSAITLNRKADYKSLKPSKIVGIGKDRQSHSAYLDYFISGKDRNETLELAKDFANGNRDKFIAPKKK